MVIDIETMQGHRLTRGYMPWRPWWNGWTNMPSRTSNYAS